MQGERRRRRRRDTLSLNTHRLEIRGEGTRGDRGQRDIEEVAEACVRAMDAENALLEPCREAIARGQRVTAREIMVWRNEMQRRRASIAGRN